MGLRPTPDGAADHVDEWFLDNCCATIHRKSRSSQSHEYGRRKVYMYI